MKGFYFSHQGNGYNSTSRTSHSEISFEVTMETFTGEVGLTLQIFSLSISPYFSHHFVGLS